MRKQPDFSVSQMKDWTMSLSKDIKPQSWRKSKLRGEQFEPLASR